MEKCSGFRAGTRAKFMPSTRAMDIYSLAYPWATDRTVCAFTRNPDVIRLVIRAFFDSARSDPTALLIILLIGVKQINSGVVHALLIARMLRIARFIGGGKPAGSIDSMNHFHSRKLFSGPLRR